MTTERPLSPHLQIYKPQISSVLSILHRGTGIGLTLGLFVLALWLIAAAAGEDAYNTFRAAVGHPLGLIASVGLSWAAFYHFCTGIRHMIWDTGARLTIPDLYKTGYFAVSASVVLTALFWAAILFI